VTDRSPAPTWTGDLDAYVRAVVDTFPPLSEATRSTVTTLLRPTAATLPFPAARPHAVRRTPHGEAA
jgi:hypothetical protein